MRTRTQGTRTRRGAAAVVLVALACLVAACSSSGASDSSKGPITPKDGETVDVAANRPFTVRLESNPTTGYSWAVKKIDGTVKFVESKYVAPKNDRAGAPGEQVLTFSAGPAGTSKVSLVYERPFAPDEPGQSLGFTADVQKA